MFSHTAPFSPFNHVNFSGNFEGLAKTTHSG
ncbi:hypothetical protein BRAS3843_3160064 [Bradyrhizobium sp. STM 3843]|nr:hypothetical protein BRAS3843_3160064 [Bradyrhizobium sp. STM 3843]